MDNKIYKVIISSGVVYMLTAHSRFIANVSENAAIQFIEEFYNKTKSLEKFPERNPFIIDPMIPDGKYRKLVIFKRYLLIYQVKGEDVYVDALLDCRQDYKWLL
ncbi:type II toxin-antitoxin system RelE/ParE family toxin [Sedimentibacter sp.]|uniref:type II toxin-antitoxin system RelE/ParE family toxin n=1 Tax=Sedimentibacter sp. TaxID=1960295 RepID=UPI0028A60B35|nr:type II toxin-antitoxin system RelE/ParE family toxin [Sedimentibacter sp.]